jgi:hypothetical protein
LQDIQGNDQTEGDNGASQTPADPAVDVALPNDPNTGESTPMEGTSNPPTPRSTPAKPSVFNKKAAIQKVKLNQDFLKNSPSSSGPQPTSTTARPMTSEKSNTHHNPPNHSKSIIRQLKGAETHVAKSSVESGGYINAAAGI